MAIMNHYEAAEDRARLLYRFPMVPDQRRTLEIYRLGEPLLRDCEWTGSSRTFFHIGASVPSRAKESQSLQGQELDLTDSLGTLPFADQSFDLVVLHRTLDELTTPALRNGTAFNPSTLLKNIYPLLAPGGIVAGCVNNRWHLTSLASELIRLGTRRSNAESKAQFSLRGLRRALSGSGYQEVRLFTLLPNISTPYKLIDTDPAISRLAFRQELEVMRHHIRFSPAYFVRRVAVELGLNRQFEESLFFWATKPC